MLSLTSSSSRIFIHALPTDMRKSFDALCGIVKGDFQKDILDGDYFVFLSGQRIALMPVLRPVLSCRKLRQYLKPNCSGDHSQDGFTAADRHQGRSERNRAKSIGGLSKPI